MTRNFLSRAPACLALGIIVSMAGCGRDNPTDPAVPSVQANMIDVAAAASPNKPSPSGYENKSFGLDVPSGNSGVVEVLCSAGKRALGGGFQIGGGFLIADTDVAIYESSPRVTSGTDGWRLEVGNRTADTRHVDVWVVCATI